MIDSLNNGTASSPEQGDQPWPNVYAKHEPIEGFQLPPRLGADVGHVGLKLVLEDPIYDHVFAKPSL